MIPTLRPGDAVVVRSGARVRRGQVVVARFRDRPDLLVVKRTVRPESGGWYVTSDNPFAVGDSAVHGPADVDGRVILRCWPRPRWPLPATPDVGPVEDFPP